MQFRFNFDRSWSPAPHGGVLQFGSRLQSAPWDANYDILRGAREIELRDAREIEYLTELNRLVAFLEAMVEDDVAHARTDLLASFHEQKRLLSTGDRKAFAREQTIDRSMIASVRDFVRTSEVRHFTASLHEIDEIIKNAQDEHTSLVFAYLSLVDFVHDTGQFAATALRRYRRRIVDSLCSGIVLLLGIILRGLARFRGIGWGHRAWFLMHGPRPPKALGFSVSSVSGGGALA